MNIKAAFPAGVTELTVHGLHQWDYGQTLRIEAPDLPAIVEVHFACAGMRDAIVRVCSSTSPGTADVAIPDQCLEQSSPVVAWVYLVGETTGETWLTVTMPVVARAQPQARPTEPETFSDTYTELISAVNAQVARLMAGNIKVSNSVYADNADQAMFADEAEEAKHAIMATGADLLIGAWTSLDPLWVKDGANIWAPALTPGATYLLRIVDYATSRSGSVLLTAGPDYADSTSSKTSLAVSHSNGSSTDAELWLQLRMDDEAGIVLTVRARQEGTQTTVATQFQVVVSYKRIA